MKIEKERIIIRVGGGYLTIEDFVEQYCEEGRQENMYNWIYHGDCKGTNNFKTFYFTKNEQSGKLDLPDYPKDGTSQEGTKSPFKNSIKKSCSASKIGQGVSSAQKKSRS
jgi:hypothetical protein